MARTDIGGTEGREGWERAKSEYDIHIALRGKMNPLFHGAVFVLLTCHAFHLPISQVLFCALHKIILKEF